jgi:hypothetical protein
MKKLLPMKNLSQLREMIFMGKFESVVINSDEFTPSDARYKLFQEKNQDREVYFKVENECLLIWGF